MSERTALNWKIFYRRSTHRLTVWQMLHWCMSCSISHVCCKQCCHNQRYKEGWGYPNNVWYGPNVLLQWKCTQKWTKYWVFLPTKHVGGITICLAWIANTGTQFWNLLAMWIWKLVPAGFKYCLYYGHGSAHILREPRLFWHHLCTCPMCFTSKPKLSDK